MSDFKQKSRFAQSSITPILWKFTTKSLSLYPTVSEMIDSFVVTSAGNRLWPVKSKTIVRPHPGDYPFYFSWNDTGRASVMVTVYRADGETFSKNYNIHLYSPLFQDSIISEVGVPFKLFTPRVRDSSLIYHWDFGKSYDRRLVRELLTSGSDSVESLVGQATGEDDLWVILGARLLRQLHLTK